MTTDWNNVLAGAFAMACWAIGLFFRRFHASTRERLFRIFAYSFWLLGLERAILTLVPPEQEGRHLVFLVRLVAFVLIIAGVLDKNRSPDRKPS